MPLNKISRPPPGSDCSVSPDSAHGALFSRRLPVIPAGFQPLASRVAYKIIFALRSPRVIHQLRGAECPHLQYKNKIPAMIKVMAILFMKTNPHCGFKSDQLYARICFSMMAVMPRKNRLLEKFLAAKDLKHELWQTLGLCQTFSLVISIITKVVVKYGVIVIKELSNDR
jgi:hypothetical protein